MSSRKFRTAGVTILAAVTGLVTAASLMLSAPASGQLTGDSPCVTARGGRCTETTTTEASPPTSAPATTPTTEVGCADFVQGACAQDGSVVSGNGRAIHGSVASGCSTAVDKSTASGGNCAPAKNVTPSPASTPASAVRGNPSFAG